MNKLIILSSLIFFLFSCKSENKSTPNEDSQTAKTVEKNSSTILNENCVIFISPSDTKIVEMKKKLGNDFYTIADDINFYSANAYEFLDSLKVKHIEANETTKFTFNDKNNILTDIIDNNNKNDWFSILYNDNDKNFKITNLIDFKANYKSFFKIKSNSNTSIKGINEIETEMNSKYSMIKNIKCDLNKDKLEDIILVFEPKNQSSSNNSDTVMDSPVLVMINQGNNKFSVSKNLNIIQTINSNCPSDGFGNIVLKDNYFTIEQNICGGWYLADEYITFKYDLEKKELILHKFSQSLTDRKNPEKEIPELNLTNKKFGNIYFEGFNRETILEKFK